MSLLVAVAALALIATGWHFVPKTWAQVDAQFGMDQDRPENASEAFNRGVSTVGMAGPVMIPVGVFVLVGALISLLLYGA